MKVNIFKLDLSGEKAPEPAVIRAVSVLRAGGIVAHPTDTCYGLAADIANEAAIKKVYEFKGRDHNKPLSIIVGNLDELAKYGEYSPLMEKMTQENPGRQFTFVVKRKKTVPEFLNPGESTVGIQIPKYKLSLALLAEFGSPLTATSANISGMSECYSAEELLAQIGEDGTMPDLIIDGGRLSHNPPSRVVRIEGEKIEILRP